MEPILETNLLEKTNNIEYNDYDQYDILDFLEKDYFDYLITLPNELWIKYKKNIERELLKISDELVINFILNKININYYDYITILVT